MGTNHGILKNKRIKRILILIVSSFLIILAVLSYLFYRYNLHNFEKTELIRLQGISNVLATQINGQDHDRLMNKYKSKDDILNSNQDSIYFKIHKVLANSYGANMLKSPIYTLIPTEAKGKYEFGVTSQNKPYFRHKYNSSPQTMLEMYDTGGAIPAYRDEFGTWLSAFSVLKNETGKTIAIIMVDEKLENFLKTARSQMVDAFLIAILLFGLMLSILLLLLKKILERENNDKIQLAESNENNAVMKAKLMIANDQLQSINTFRKEMITNISHDLRTPLSNTIGYIEYIKDTAELNDQKKMEYLDIAHKEAIKLRDMVSDLFELSKLESNEILLHIEPINILEIIQDIIQKYKLQINAKQIDLQFKIDEDLPYVKGDLKYVNRLFQNLMDNAVRHTYEGKFILITVQNYRDTVKIKVCNYGETITKEDQAFLFDRYYKASSKSGSGLGLSIVKKICELHNTEIVLEVNDHVISFWFKLQVMGEQLKKMPIGDN